MNATGRAIPDLGAAAHRPWPLPRRVWAMRMVWHDLAFLHWPVPAESFAPQLPVGLELDTFEGQAWLGVVPFRMSGVAARWLPDLPGLSAFPELNVRTYVVHDGKPGVWFLSLDATNRIAVRLARWRFHLPYQWARMSCTRNGQTASDGIDYRCERCVPVDEMPARFRARYRPSSQVRTATAGSLEHWLVERYCLYAASPAGQLFRGDIHHAPWPLQDAEIEIEENTMTEPLGLPAPTGTPLAHFSRRLETVAWLPQAVGGGEPHQGTQGTRR